MTCSLRDVEELDRAFEVDDFDCFFPSDDWNASNAFPRLATKGVCNKRVS